MAPYVWARGYISTFYFTQLSPCMPFCPPSSSSPFIVSVYSSLFLLSVLPIHKLAKDTVENFASFQSSGFAGVYIYFSITLNEDQFHLGNGKGPQSGLDIVQPSYQITVINPYLLVKVKPSCVLENVGHL